MSDTWSKILEQVFIGLDRKPKPPPELQGEVEHLYPSMPKGLDIQDQIALLSIAQKADYPTILIPNTDQEIISENAEEPFAYELVSCHSAIKAYGEEFLFREIAGNLAQNDMFIPPYYLPDVLNMLKQKPFLLNEFLPVFGDRAVWLIRENPEWNFLDPFQSLNAFLSLDPNNQSAVISALCATDPEKGALLITDTWDSSDIHYKKRILKAIICLGMGEIMEAFLMNVLKGRSLSLRKLAAGLLGEKANSDWKEEVLKAIPQFAELRGAGSSKQKIIINIPDSWPDVLIRNGFLDKKPTSEVDPASFISSLFELTPPDFFTEAFNISPEDLIDTLIRSEQGVSIISSLMQSSIRYKALDWQIPLCKIPIQYQKKLRWQNLPLKSWLNSLEDRAFQYLCEQLLAKEAGVIEASHILSEALLKRNGPWSEKMSMILIGNFCKWLENAGGNYWESWHYRGLIKKAAKFAPPDLASKIKTLWPVNSRAWGSWETVADEFQHIMDWRNKVLNASKV